MKNDTHLNHNVFYNKKKDQYKGFCKTLSSIAHENLRGVQKCQLKINWILTFFLISQCDLPIFITRLDYESN